MARAGSGMRPYDPKPETGYGCHSCIHVENGCNQECTPNEAGGTGYEFNNVLNHKMFWLRKQKISEA